MTIQYITTNGQISGASPRFWRWVQMINLHRGGLPVGHPSPNDDGIIAMHLLAYVAIKYPEEYCPTVVGAVNGRSFGRIDFKKDGDEFYMIYTSARTGEREQVTLMFNGKKYCSIEMMNMVTKIITEPQIVKDDDSKTTIEKDDNVAPAFNKYAAYSVPMGSPVGSPSSSPESCKACYCNSNDMSHVNKHTCGRC